MASKDIRTWTKYRQYAWTMSILWGKMVITIDAEGLAGQCPHLYNEAGLICPVFTESDIPQIVNMYMSLYPEHRGFEERLKWIIRCLFSGGQVPATPPNVLTRAPYLEKRQFPASILPEPPGTQYILPVPGPEAEPGPSALGGVPNWAIYAGLGLLAYYVFIRS